jgi:hypothetical protein
VLRIALLAALALPPGGGWTFVDEAFRDGRQVVTFRTVELADTPTRPLHRDDVPPAKARFGTLALGPGGKHRLGLVWHAASGAVWLDADADGRYAIAERHLLGAKPLEVRVRIPFGEKHSVERTLLIRRRGDGLAYAVRGYTLGAVTLGGRAVAAMLTDGDADGCFDGVGADRVWLDLDGDRTFDPLTEQFPLGTALTHGGTAFLLQPQADGLGLVVRERPAEAGTLAVKVARMPGAEVAELAVQYVSEWGELVSVKEADKAVSVPAGRYRVESVRLKLTDAAGKVWHYQFATGDRAGFDVEVAVGRAVVHQPLDGLKVSVTLDAAGGVAPGDSVLVYPDVTAGRLYLTRCEVAEKHAEHGRELLAELKLTEPGSVALDRASSGFN